jgi:hypothetical protein
MKKPLLVLASALCVAAISGQAQAFCGDAAQSCSQAFTNGAANPQDGTTSSQGFDPQSGRQWSTDTTKFGNFTLHSGFSQGDSWNSPQARFGDRFNNAAGLNSQSQSNSDYCALYGTCK